MRDQGSCAARQTVDRHACNPPQDPPAINFDEWKKETDPKLVEMFQKAYSGASPPLLSVAWPCARLAGTRRMMLLWCMVWPKLEGRVPPR